MTALVVIPASGVSPRAGTQGEERHAHMLLIPDTSLRDNCGMTVRGE